MAEGASSSFAPAGETRPPRVLYVMGAGRSGSTILGVALGNCEGFFFAGELDRWLARRGRPRREDADMLALWQAVSAEVGDLSDLPPRTSTALERSSVLLRPHRWPVRRRNRAAYRRISRALYLALAGVTGASHIVDTSHYPLRARELQALDIELYLLLLVRDPGRVVASLGRHDVAERRYSPWAANAYLALTHLLSLAVFRRHPPARRMLVSHEQLVSDPEGVITRILELCGSEAAVPDTTRLMTGLAFHGNRLLDAERVAIQGPPEGAAPRSRLTGAVQRPLLAMLDRAARRGPRGHRSAP